MRIRNYKADDAEALASILHLAVHAIGRRDYSAIQVAAWSPEPEPAKRFAARLTDGRDVFVAVDEDDLPMAFVELEQDGHIDCFYCRPDVAGTGVGKALYQHLEEAAAEAGMTRLYTEASEAARRFFLREGFSVVKRRDFLVREVPIHNYAMEKYLSENL